jgi:hypothetical protein
MITITVDDRAIRKAFAAAPVLLARELSREVAVFVAKTTSEFQKVGLRAKDDRNRGDFLLRRPPSSMGLRRVTGQIASSLIAAPGPVVSEIGKVRSQVGFTTGRGARIARVHELGTIRYGGTLPDIVPKRAKYLAIPIRGGKVARGTKVLYVARVLKVGIPPRLGFRIFWTSRAKVAELNKRALGAARRALGKAAKRG